MSLSLTALSWMVLGEWRAHPARVVVAAFAIAIGVALGFAVHLVNLSALNEFTLAVRTVDGNADLQVQSAAPSGFDEALYPKLAWLAGIDDVSPVVELTASAGSGVTITLLGLDVLRAVNVTPGLAAAASAFDPAALYLSAAALRAFNRKIGDEVTLFAGGHAASFTIVGTLLQIGGDQRIGVIDIASAQWHFGLLGRLQRIDIRLVQGANVDLIRQNLQAMLPPDAVIVSEQSETRRTDSFSRAYRVNLEMLAMVALLTGGFLVYSAQSLSVTRRQPQFALLRVLGLHRRALLAQMLVEGLIVGLLGAVCGIGLGYGLALLTLRIMGGDLGGGYFNNAQPSLVFPPIAAGVLLALGIVVALAGSLLPALNALRAAPAVALKNSGEVNDPSRRPAAWTGIGLLAAGGLTALLPPIWGLPLFGYASIALLLAGGVASMPWLAGSLLAPVQRWRNPGAVFHLAVTRLWGAPSQAAVALCGIVASTSLMVAMAVMVSSFRGSVDDWLTQVLQADIYLRLDATDLGGWDRTFQARLAALPGIESTAFRKTISLRLKPDIPVVALTAVRVNRSALPLIGNSRTVPPGETPVWISEPMGWLYDLHPGDRMTLPLSGAGMPVFVAGVWRDYARQFGAIVMDDRDYTRLTGDTFRTEAAINLDPGASAPVVIAAIGAILPPEFAAQTAIAEPREIRRTALRLFDRSFAATYALEVIAVVIGLTGVAATFSAQILARIREFGMLRHIGVQRRQIVLMLAIEGALLGVVGGITGLCLGIAMGEILIHVVNPQSFHWTMETRLPWALFTLLFAALITASSGTVVLAGRRALSADSVLAVREDW